MQTLKEILKLNETCLYDNTQPFIQMSRFLIILGLSTMILVSAIHFLW